MRASHHLPALALALVALIARPAAAAPVSGRLAAPGRALPALSLYAWSLNGARLYSVTTESGQARFTIELPVGRYYLFATPADPGAPALYGAYTEFAACARRAPHARACTEHGLRLVAVGRNAVDGIDLTDWYLADEVARELDRLLGRPGDTAVAEAELTAPRFSEYPAVVFSGPRAAALVPGSLAHGAADLEVLTAALGSGANFAGRAVLTRIGCGADCEAVAIVDLPSGRAYYPAPLARLPVLPACSGGAVLQFRRDSRLLTVTGLSGAQQVTRYLVWEANRGTPRLVAALAGAAREHSTAPR